MPIDQATAMAHARANFIYLAEAKSLTELDRLKTGAEGYNQSLHMAKIVDGDQFEQLTAELEEAYEVQKRQLSVE